MNIFTTIPKQLVKIPHFRNVAVNMATLWQQCCIEKKGGWRAGPKTYMVNPEAGPLAYQGPAVLTACKCDKKDILGNSSICYLAVESTFINSFH
jgi:hypothetical protein